MAKTKRTLARLAFDGIFLLFFCVIVGISATAVGLVRHATSSAPTWLAWSLAPLYAVLFVLGFIASAFLVRVSLPRLIPGSYPFPAHRQSAVWLLHLALRGVVHLPPFPQLVFSLSSLRWLFLRAMGARARFDINTGFDTLFLDPSLVDLGEGVMVAAGCRIAGHFVEKDELLLDRVELADGVQIHGNCMIAPGVRIGAHSLLGLATQVGPGVRIGAYTHLGSGCQIHARASIGDNCVVGHDVTLEANVVLEDNAIVQSGYRVPKGTRVREGERYPTRTQRAVA